MNASNQLTENLKPLVEQTIKEHGALTLAQIAELTKHNYYTIRKCVRSMQADGILTTPTNFQYRNVKYILNTKSGNTLPTILQGDTSYKLIELLALRSNPSPSAALAVINLPKHITRILKYAVDITNDPENVNSRKLQAIRISMEQDAEALTRALDAYTQILGNARCWDIASISNFVVDTEFDEGEVLNAHKHYFSEE